MSDLWRADTLHRFCKKEHDWGWKKFMELSKVLEGFTVADTLVIKAQVQVIRYATYTLGLSMHGPSACSVSFGNACATARCSQVAFEALAPMLCCCTPVEVQQVCIMLQKIVHSH